ncbi:aminoglycoside phosphotransferase family protein [Glycomyces arizonensis]|uniref:aminoglycoside phosphotransferase family protein n=1 Tax=Glycomyces arizonensis TaxID=256035 RepID=UPI000418D22C|nr:aminoglycoside phosphotransferase family protein [Glycomyces arizonensis]
MRFDPFPEGVRRAVHGWHADAGDRWLASVPGTVDRLMRDWALRRTGPPFEGGSHSYVLPVERADGTPAVLKVIYRDAENLAEPTALRAYGGDGAVELREYDAATGAMLLERAEPGAPLLEREFPGLGERAAARERVAIACGLYRRLWRAPAPPGEYPAYPKAADMLAAWEARFADPAAALLDRLGREWAKRAAAWCAELRIPLEEGIANRDTHLGNIVSARREPWLLIDPKPYVAERAFDGGFLVFKQALHGPLGGAESVRAVAEDLGAEVERVRAWAALRGIDFACDAADRGELAAVLGAVESILD